MLSLLIAYPLAYYLAVKASRRVKLLLLILVIVPFWTSFLVRTYAWIFILGGRGLPALIEWLGLGSPRLIYTPFAVLVGIVYGYLPLMVFPIFVSLEKLDKSLLEASDDLGANPIRTFFAGDAAVVGADNKTRRISDLKQLLKNLVAASVARGQKDQNEREQP